MKIKSSRASTISLALFLVFPTYALSHRVFAILYIYTLSIYPHARGYKVNGLALGLAPPRAHIRMTKLFCGKCTCSLFTHMENPLKVTAYTQSAAARQQKYILTIKRKRERDV